MNLALNKNVFVSTADPGYPKEKLVDGDKTLSGSWLATVAGTTRGSWCIVDLGTKCLLTDIVLHVFRGCVIFDIEISLDNITYTSVATDLTIPIETFQTFTQVNNLEARYIKINNIGAYATGNNHGIAELEVNGTIINPNNIHYLFESNNNIYTHDGNTFIQLLEPLTPTLFINEGLEVLNLPNYELNKLDNVSILIFTDNQSITQAEIHYITEEFNPLWLELSTQPFKPIDILNKAESFEVLTWTDESSSVELQANGNLQTIDSGKLFSFELNDFNTITNIITS